MNSRYPYIVTALDPQYKKGNLDLQAVQNILDHVLSKNFFENPRSSLLRSQLPLIAYSPLLEPPFDIHFFLCCRFRQNAFRFFCEMIRQWLIPGKQSNILLQFAVDFAMPDLMEEYLTAGQLSLRCENTYEKELITRNLPPLITDLRLGVESPYQASRVLEIRGMNYDEKTLLIQESITQLLKHRPQDFDYDIMTTMQYFLVLCKDDFKRARSARHISRIICVHYLFHKALKLSLDAFPGRRYISVKLIRTHLKGGEKVLGVIVGLSFLKDTEIFEARHILGAIKTRVAEAQKVEGSFYRSYPSADSTYMMYIEVIKANGEFTQEEVRELKQHLPLELKGRIEQRLNPLFMPQNEEEIMRYIVTLSGELKYVRDVPQVILDFSCQTEEKLEFLVVMLRVNSPHQHSIQECFDAQPSSLECLVDRTKIVGEIRGKYKKEASVFRVRLSKTSFLRQDHSVDLYQARQEVTHKLKQIFGDFRDYHGGMISKETELFSALRQSLGDVAEENHVLLESFFFALHPAVMRSILPIEVLKRLFTMILDAEIEGLPLGQSYQIRIEEDGSNFYLLVIAEDDSFAEELMEHLQRLDSVNIATCLIQQTESPCFGLICRHLDPEEARELWHELENILGSWADKKNLSLSR